MWCAARLVNIQPREAGYEYGCDRGYGFQSPSEAIDGGPRCYFDSVRNGFPFAITFPSDTVCPPALVHGFSIKYPNGVNKRRNVWPNKKMFL